MQTGQHQNLKGPGGAFFAIGIVFFGLGISTQPTFLGIGAAFLALGIVFLGKARQGNTQ